MIVAYLKVREEWVHCLPVTDFSDEGELGDEASNLPHELASKFVRWNDSFLEKFELDKGWPDLATYKEHVETAEGLVQELRMFLGESLPVRLELWATEIFDR